MFHNPNGSKIIVAGDWHRNLKAVFPKRVIKIAAELGIDTIVHVGDFGYNFNTSTAYTFEKPLQMALEKHNVKIFWVDGNHENHEYLQNLTPEESGFIKTGAKGNVFYAPRGHRWNWRGKDFGALGGAWSPNYAKLEEGRTLFQHLEETKQEDLDRLGDASLDYLITHEVPQRLRIKTSCQLIREINPSRLFVQEAVDLTQPDRIFSGHWHTRLDYDLLLRGGKILQGSILDKEFTTGNALILDIDTNTIEEIPRELWIK